MSHAHPVTSTLPLPAPQPTPKNGKPLGNLNPHNHFHIPENRGGFASPPVKMESEHQQFNRLFFEDLQTFQEYAQLSVQRRFSEVVKIFEKLIQDKPEKYKLLLDHLVRAWPKISPEASLSTLELLEKLANKEPLLSHVILILRGAIRITQGMHSTGIVMIMHGLQKNSSSRTLERYLWPVLKQLRSDEKLLKALEKPEEAILPLPIYFFRGILALSDQKFEEAKRWLDRSVSDDFSQEKVDAILESARKKRPPLQEISHGTSKAPAAAKPQPDVSQLPSPMIYVLHKQPAPLPQIPPEASSMRAPPQPARVDIPQAQQLPPPPQTPPVVLRIPGQAFLAPFFETLENFTANNQLHQQNAIDRQVQLYSQLIQRNPQKYPLLVNALFDLFPFNGAIPDIQTLEMLSQLNPNDPMPDILSGAYMIRNGEYQRGIELFKRGYSKYPSPHLVQSILMLMQKWLATNPHNQLQQQMPQNDLSLFKGIIVLLRNQLVIANTHFEHALNNPSSKPLAQAFREHMGIPEQSRSLEPLSPLSPNAQIAAEALSSLSQAPANPSALS